ncbi:MAG: phosphotransferase [Alphaproteobacteria bacterium]|nr:phosphotransferase [Alphaproteobacteria bacterium]
MLKFIKKLNGHSGCELSLFSSEDGKIFVRKKSSSFEYNLRLKKQFIKQNKYNLDMAKTPKIYGYGMDDNLFFFDMEYVSGITFSEYINTIKITELIDYIKILFSSLPINCSQKNFNVNKIFEKKIFSLSSNIKSKNQIIKQALDFLEFNDWTNVVQSPSHGDLTLENIMISNDNKLYLIDFLDTFFSSWLIDLAKIFQDIETKWAFRNTPSDTNRDLRLLIAKETLCEMILCLPDGRNILRQIYKILLLNLLRIIPYTTDEKTKNFLYNSIEKTINIIEKMKG